MLFNYRFAGGISSLILRSQTAFNRELSPSLVVIEITPLVEVSVRLL